ncbi:hypothetical protein A6P39_002890 [Streptomyces sp. FXJ1.172]|uniref:hypothetical protein n=1 Tax=Streptomyces sp. FXJ1.172 TaxID=710705 RepID=UPI0023DD0660|nr:hypothetical protein [Streptomyces sp. FXJ1.172]WEO93099.1 hypothetical protein A6P39_002890 [Streptomyces sp. FXJ1.172]
MPTTSTGSGTIPASVGTCWDNGVLPGARRLLHDRRLRHAELRHVLVAVHRLAAREARTGSPDAAVARGASGGSP